MGFRDPITSAVDVDTGRGPSDAGARLYQDTTVPAVPVGVAEWRTGTMTRNATAKLAGGGSGGSSFVIDGGSTQGVDAPTLDLNVEGLPAGGYGPVARLVTGAGGRALTGAPWQLDAAYSALPLGGTFVAFDAPNTPRLAHLSNGDVRLEGIAKLNSGTLAAGAGAVAAVLPAGLEPAVNIHRPTVIITAAAAYFAGGWLTISAGSRNVTVWNTTAGAFGVGASFLLGCTYAPASSLTT